MAKVKKFPKKIKFDEFSMVYKHKGKVVWTANRWYAGENVVVKNPIDKLDEVLEVVSSFLEKNKSKAWYVIKERK